MKTLNDQIFDAWKRQADLGMKLLEAMVQVTGKLRGMQQAAANETQRRTAEAGKAAAQANDPQDLWRAQYELALRNCEDASLYWSGVFEAMGELNGRMLECVRQSAPQIPPAGASAESTVLTVPGELALRLWNDMYRQVGAFARSVGETAGGGQPVAKPGERTRKQGQAGA